MPAIQSLIVFSHRRWDGFHQRPQHLLTRLARQWQVVYVEEPVPGSARNGLDVFEPAPGVQVWRPNVTGDAHGFHDDHMPALKLMVEDAVRERGIRNHWLWFYTPMALPLGRDLKPRGIVYDCMDELSHLEQAPRELVQRENALFKIADMVFTGGPSIYNTKRSRHPDVHCFPGSVDAAHFERITGEHPLHDDIPRPRIGYSGVIDGRINLALIDAIAKARPEWNIVMVGPVTGIDARSLPRPDNIHWLGPQSYDDLPKFIKGWDVCLMPFALNDATRFISPNKTLEYMACGRPAVSTSIRDIVEPYGHVVRIADTPEGFVADIEMLLARPRAERERHARELMEIAARTSWDATAAGIADLISQADELADAGAAIPLPLAAVSQAALPSGDAHPGQRVLARSDGRTVELRVG